MEETKEFKKEYDSFIAHYKSNIVTSEDVGKQIGIQIQYYGNILREFVDNKIKYDRRLAELEQSIDENTGKVYSSTKAAKIVKSTPEGASRLRTENDLKLVLEQVGALRDIQRGIQHEQKMMGGM